MRQLLIDTPGLGSWLERIAGNAAKPLAKQASQLLAELSIAPPYRLEVAERWANCPSPGATVASSVDTGIDDNGCRTSSSIS